MPNYINPYTPPAHLNDPPPGPGPVHFRWTTPHFWTWVDERVQWLDDEAVKQEDRKARRLAEWKALKS
jgi:hypothetical protein